MTILAGIPVATTSDIIDIQNEPEPEPDAESEPEPTLETEPLAPPEPTSEIQSVPAYKPLTVVANLAIPAYNTGFKSFMDYRKITNTKSAQWRLQQDAVTDEYGFRRYAGYYMIALGSFYTHDEVGLKFRITLESGTVFEAITGDIKDDKDTDSTNRHKDGNIVEFIVDRNLIPAYCDLTGDMSHINNFSGKIVSIELLE